MQKRIIFDLLCLTAASATLVGSGAAYGENSVSRGFDSSAIGKEEEEVIVRAQLREEPLLEVPVAVTLINEEFIKTSGASHLSDLEFAIPSVNFGRGGRKTHGEITIRGIGDYSRNIGNDARVVVYVDGVPFVRSSTFNLALLDIKQIEVLRGPQGTFFGTNTVAGAINITTSIAEDELQNSALIGIGNFNKRLVQVSSNLPLTSTFMTRIEIGKEQQDGFIDNITLNKEIQGQDYETARIKFRYLPSKNIDLRLNMDWLDEAADATNALALADDGTFNGYSQAPGAREVAHDTEEYEKRTVWGGSFSANVKTQQDFEWIAISAYRDNQFSNLNEEDYSSIPAVFTFFNETSDQFSQELRLVSPQFDSVDYILGAFYLQQNVATERYASLSGATATTPGEVRTDSMSLYSHLNYRFADNWEFSVGSRYVNEEKQIDYEIIDNIGSFTNGTYEDKETFSALLPSLGINYTTQTDGNIYLSFSKSFKPGGWNADFVTTLNNLQFEEEHASNWEIGYKNEYFNETLVLNLALFHIQIDDLQIFQFVEHNENTLLELNNAGQATSQGIELDLSMQLTSQLNFTFNSAYTDANFDSFKNGGGIGIDYDGNTLPYAPKWKHFIALDYISDMFYAHLDYSYTSDYYSNPNNAENFNTPSYSIINARVGVSLNDSWDISAWVQNLSDSTHLRFRDESFLRIQRGYYEEPRTFGLTIRFEN